MTNIQRNQQKKTFCEKACTIKIDTVIMFKEADLSRIVLQCKLHVLGTRWSISRKKVRLFSLRDSTKRFFTKRLLKARKASSQRKSGGDSRGYGTFLAESALQSDKAYTKNGAVSPLAARFFRNGFCILQVLRGARVGDLLQLVRPYGNVLIRSQISVWSVIWTTKDETIRRYIADIDTVIKRITIRPRKRRKNPRLTSIDPYHRHTVITGH